MSVDVHPTRVLTPLAVEWLEMLPPVLQGDPWIQAILNALALEMQRVIDQAEALAEGLIPTTANEHTLALWEALVGLPVSPPNTSIEVRRSLVMSRLLRGDGSGAQWEQALASATADSARYTENDSGDPQVPWYTIRIDTSLPPGVTIQSLRDYIRQITPANLHVDVVGGQTYGQVNSRYASYTAARSGNRDYDNLRYGVA